MDEALASTLREAVLDHLTHVDMLARDGDERSRAAVATTEITRLTSAWRVLLYQHQPDANGRCPQCSSALRRRRRHPCPVWATAHQQLVADDERPAAAGRHTRVARRHATNLAAL